MSLNISSYPKIYNMGHKEVSNILSYPVVVQEKVDGSQFSFGVFGGQLHCRSKNNEMDISAPEGMFQKGVDTAVMLWQEGALVDGWVYRGEYLQKPKHNALTYNRVPAGNIVLFDIEVGEQDFLSPRDLREEAEKLGLESVPVLLDVTGGEINNSSDFLDLLDNESFLGGPKIEGVVVKAYGYYGRDKKTLMAKYVSEAFKEKHKESWGESNPSGKDFIELLVEQYTTEARWQKAVQHLRDAGQLEGSPRDIGLLIRAVPEDIREECEDEIKDALFGHFWKPISRGVTRGFPEWYKQKLLEQSFEE